jgi:cysteine synthase
MGNYRFHYHVTGNTLVELADVLKRRGVGDGKIAAYCSAMGSSGTIAAGDRLKQVWGDHKVVGLEPIQCSTLYNSSCRSRHPGIGDKRDVGHNVMNMDAIMCLDDIGCKKACSC